MQSIFGRALEIESTADRAAYLDKACGPDAALRAEVEGLLATLGRAGAFMCRPAAAVAAGITASFEPLTERPGTKVGPYKLLQQIGEGVVSGFADGARSNGPGWRSCVPGWVRCPICRTHPGRITDTLQATDVT
jgi:hypothetical protein